MPPQELKSPRSPQNIDLPANKDQPNTQELQRDLHLPVFIFFLEAILESYTRAQMTFQNGHQPQRANSAESTTSLALSI